MTPFFLQESLVNELKNNVFKDYILGMVDERGRKVGNKTLNIYSQRLPLRKSKIQGYTQEELENGLVYDERVDDCFPYIIVCLNEGTIENESSGHEISIVLYIGVCDNADDVNGYKDVLSIIAKIYERFGKNPLLDNKYVFRYPITWALQDEKENADTYPYFFGGIEMRFETYAIVKEDSFA